ATKFIGRELDVLFEQNIEGNKYEGLTSNYIRVVVESDKNIQGQILKVKINDVKDEYVEGILL
ncbi:TRAM domain-containing protein, partial [Clostridioides difficile]